MKKKISMGAINVHNVRRIEITRLDKRWLDVVLWGDGDESVRITAFTAEEGVSIEVIDHERPAEEQPEPDRDTGAMSEKAHDAAFLLSCIEARQWSDCPECGLFVAVDEDGCSRSVCAAPHGCRPRPRPARCGAR